MIPFPCLLRACGFPPSTINCSRSHYDVVEDKYKCPIDDRYYPVEEIAPDRTMETEYIWRKKMSRNIQTGSIKGIYTNTIKNFATKLTSS